MARPSGTFSPLNRLSGGRKGPPGKAFRESQPTTEEKSMPQRKRGVSSPVTGWSERAGQETVEGYELVQKE